MTPRRGPRNGRPSPPPPALRFAEGELFPATEILEELREPLAVLLWQAVHDVHLWADAAPGSRAGLFQAGALERRRATLGRSVHDSELAPLLGGLATLLMEEPETADPAEIAAACLAVAAWAERRGAAGTALAFAVAAALASPEDPHPALETGRLALGRGEDARAESWLRRALVLARQQGANPAYARTCVALGNLHARRKQSGEARRFYLFAMRRARRSGLREEKAAALHGLFDLARAGSIPENADALARSALHLYGAAHPRAPELFGDWVRLRLARDPSDTVLGGPDDPLPFRGPPWARARLLAVLARAAGEAGAREPFERAWLRAWDLLGRYAHRDPGRGWGGLRLELGRAAEAAERWELAELAGQRALEAALADGEEGERAEVERFLEGLWRRSGGMRWIGKPHGPEGSG